MISALKSILVIVWLVVLGCVFAASIDATQKISQKAHRLVSLPPLAELSPRLIDVLFLGHIGLYHDFIHLWTMQVLTDDEAKKADPDEIEHFIDALVRFEPKIEVFYLLTCFFMSSEMKRPESCRDINLAGLRAFPESWRIPMTEGYIRSKLLNDPVGASSFFALAATRGERSPPWVLNLAKRLANDANANDEELEKTMEFMMGVQGGERFRQFYRHARETWKDDRPRENEQE